MRSFRAFLLVVAAPAILACQASAQTVDINPLAKQEVLDQISDVIAKNAFVPGLDFKKWPDFLKQEQPAIDAANTDDDFQRAVNAALRKFGATHMSLYTPQVSELRQAGFSVGVGITVTRVADGLLVTRTVDDAPAQRGGIVPGDVITGVDGKPPSGAVGIAGSEGSEVTLTVRHADKTSEDYTLTRRRFSTVRPIELTWVDKQTPKLTVYSFDASYDQTRIEDLMKDAEGSPNLILDLRDNGGGLIANFRKLLGLFVPASKPIGTFIDRRMVDDYVDATHLNPLDLAAVAKWSPRKLRPVESENLPVYKGHIIVLINHLSGSAAEIVAEGLRDTVGATIVGAKSAGAVLVAMYVPASNGFLLQFPLSDYLTIKGVRLEGTGVTPDVTVTDPNLSPVGKPDAAVAKAIELCGRDKTGDHVEVG